MRPRRSARRRAGAAGSLGTLATFSFYPSKNLGAMGDGGAVTTNDAALAERVRTLRFHGSRDKVTYEEVGYNSRLDELQAAVLNVLLTRLRGWCDQRRQVAEWYAEEGLPGPPVRPGVTPAWHLHVIRDADPDALASRLAAEGVQSRAYYRTPVHLQPAMAAWPPRVPLPGTEEASRGPPCSADGAHVVSGRRRCRGGCGCRAFVAGRGAVYGGQRGGGAACPWRSTHPPRSAVRR